MEVTHITGLSFTVSSQSNPGSSYAVDLDGPPDEACTCEDFWNRHAPQIRKGGKLEDHNCKHIKKIRDWVFWNLILKEK